MNKGKELMKSLRSRRGGRSFDNYDEEQDWEDAMIYKAEGMKVKITKWPDQEALSVLHIEEDFAHFLQVTNLTEFARSPKTTYLELSREFLATFRFEHNKGKVRVRGKDTPSSFIVKFFMRGKRLVMPLEEFCKAIKVPYEGSWEIIDADSDESLREFWRSISVDVPMDIMRGKFTHIQHPALRYFALFLCRGFLARKNATGCTGPIIYLLRCAIKGVKPEYNLGVILARTLNRVVKHNETKPLYCGAIATLVFEYLEKERNFKSMGTPVQGASLLDVSTLFRMGILKTYNSYTVYQYMARRGRLGTTLLPRVEYFDRLSNKWTVPIDENEWEEELEPALPDERRNYTHASDLESWGGLPAVPQYHSGEGSSSQYIDTSAPQQWAPWEPQEQPPQYGDGGFGWGNYPNYPDY